jgi:hypothetical protein
LLLLEPEMSKPGQELLLPEITLRAATFEPPTKLFVAFPRRAMPALLPTRQLLTAAVPSALVPIRLPWIWVPLALTTLTPPKSLPESRLPAPATLPPIREFGAPLMAMPSLPLGSAAVPAAFVPM